MTKEQFETYNGMLHCKTCGVDVPKIHITYKKVYKNGDITRCNVCEWIKRHHGIPYIDGFCETEIITALYFLLYEESIYINDLAEKLHKTLEDTIYLFRRLNVGNKKCLVKTTCEYCQKETIKPINVYTSNENIYCSLECYWKDKSSKMPHGKDSPFYNRIKTICTNCGKEINVIPHNYNLENSYGDNHNFCSQECYWEYRSKYYVGDKCYMTNYQFTDEQKEKMKIVLINNSRNAKRLNSGIQLKINQILDSEHIKYEREYIIKYYAADNYLCDYNLIIEVMGDYWHGNPLVYHENHYCLNESQQRTIVKDKQKATYILTHKNIHCLYLWERDINTNPELCKKLILKYIENNGNLENYHSFNWELKDDSLFLCKNLIIPYQDMKTNDYRNLIKKKAG